MESPLLRVGILGASPDRGWARIAHVPAIQRLPGFALAAVAAQSKDAANRAAAAFGAPRGYGDAAAMMLDADIDLVTVAVRVPAHRELVLGALAAGKHVFCEWPLGRDLAEAEELRDAAAAAGLRAAIGLQARSSPALLRARALVASGAVGRVRTARMVSGTVAFGPTVDPAETYLEDPASGATHLAIHGGHALDAAIAVLGPLRHLAALATTQFPDVEIAGTGGRHRRSIPDHLLVQARLEAGGAVSVEVAGGQGPDAAFRLEVTGDRGVLVLAGAAPRGFQSGRLHLSLNGRAGTVDDGEAAALPDAAANVAAAYAVLRDDILHGTTVAPGFAHAVRLTRLVADVGRAAAEGCRIPAEDWPEN